MTVRLFGASQVATALGVTKSAVSNWLTRYNDTPEPFAVISNHRFGDTFLWDESGLIAWVEWFHECRVTS